MPMPANSLESTKREEKHLQKQLVAQMRYIIRLLDCETYNAGVKTERNMGNPRFKHWSIRSGAS